MGNGELAMGNFVPRCAQRWRIVVDRDLGLSLPCRCIESVHLAGDCKKRMALALRQSSQLEHHSSGQCILFSTDETAMDEDMLNFGFDFSHNYLDNVSHISSTSSLSHSEEGDADSVQTQQSAYNSNFDSQSPGASTVARTKTTVKKSVRRKDGGKLENTMVAKTAADPQPVNPNRAPNLSRKFRGLKLYAFPSFDKCDSLVFFPNSMSRYLNSGDYQGLGQLMGAHFHRSCMVRISPLVNVRITAGMFYKMFELMNEAHPDSVLIVHTTKVVENSIQARMYFKFTDSQIINRSMARRVTDEVFNPLFTRPRSDMFKDNMNLQKKSDAEKNALVAIVDSEVDLVVYGKIDFRLCFDDSKKVTNVDFLCEFTSLSTAQVAALGSGEDL